MIMLHCMKPMNINILLKCILMILALTMAGGCGKHKVRKLIDNLDTAITNYKVSLRWEQYQLAYDYHISPDGTQPTADLEKLGEISITGIQSLEKTLNEDNTEATVKLTITYFFKNQGTLKEIKLEHRWWFDETTEKWFIDGKFPEF